MLDLNHRSPNERLNFLVDAALEAENAKQTPRDYLGGSRLGVACLRALQFEFLNTPKDEGKGFGGKTLRTFAFGHHIESLAVDWLQTAGFDLRTIGDDGQQYGFSLLDGRIRGHIDGVLCDGPPEIAYPALFECKSMNAKKWGELVSKGVAKSHPVYAAQVAVYQKEMLLHENPAVLTAINKNTSEIHFEMIPYNVALAESSIAKGVKVIQACDKGVALERIANNPDHWECRFCGWSIRCWRMPI